VDYFLFDLKTGYCDYYATAMAVLARASGIPSRLSIGYASGNYYPELAIYRVSEANAHSWPELYFPGIGWVEFEPTASLPQIERPKGLQLADDQFPVPLVKEAEPLFPFNFNAPGLWFAGLLLVVGCVVAWLIGDTWRLKRLVPQQTIRILYARLLKRGSSLGVRVQTGDTPNEFTNRLINVYRRLVEGKPWEPAFDVLQRESLRLVGLYNRSIYSQKPDTLNAVRIWQLLRWRLWLLRNSIRMRLNKRHSG
jgi:hypothetical protein